jgi:CelD/BcsL family acetyltransferase involved in cellulose biosynthesis
MGHITMNAFSFDGKRCAEETSLMLAGNVYTVASETIENFSSLWHNNEIPLNWNCLFVIPAWINTWINHFSTDAVPRFISIRSGKILIGIAPLLFQGNRAGLIGSENVCDYLDLIIVPGRENDFYRALLEYLRGKGISHLVLGPLRADSAVLSHFTGIAKSLKYKVLKEQNDVIFELDLPATWDQYLEMLPGKQRHEVRRKLRRIHEAGNIAYRSVDGRNAIRDSFQTFIKLFKSSRPEKLAFMTDRMESFFFSLAETMADKNILRLAFLDIDAEPAAAIMCFDYKATDFLYNSGYDQKYRRLDAGLTCKILSIKDSIKRGQKKYNFLKGAEVYKERLGGKPVKLYTVRIDFP